MKDAANSTRTEYEALKKIGEKVRSEGEAAALREAQAASEAAEAVEATRRAKAETEIVKANAAAEAAAAAAVVAAAASTQATIPKAAENNAVNSGVGPESVAAATRVRSRSPRFYTGGVDEKVAAEPDRNQSDGPAAR